MPYSKSYRSRFRRAVLLREKGDADGAIRIPRRLSVEFPKKAAAYPIIGDILWDEDKLAEASKEFRAATKHFPNSKIASLALFHTLWAQFKTDAAFDEMKRLQSISSCSDYEDIVNETLQKG